MSTPEMPSFTAERNMLVRLFASSDFSDAEAEIAIEFVGVLLEGAFRQGYQRRMQETPIEGSKAAGPASPSFSHGLFPRVADRDSL